ncbi:MAG TPA: response regulator [Terriglobales bacterium]|jgi:two-component system response regulator MprA
MPTRLLLVDDEETIREVGSSMLSNQGYECVQAGDGEEALALFDSGEKFDLVLLDVLMPKVDGLMVLETLKKRYPELPVLMVCAVSDQQVIKRTLELGAFAYLICPFERKELLEAVQGALASVGKS